MYICCGSVTGKKSKFLSQATLLWVTHVLSEELKCYSSAKVAEFIGCRYSTITDSPLRPHILKAKGLEGKWIDIWFPRSHSKHSHAHEDSFNEKTNFNLFLLSFIVCMCEAFIIFFLAENERKLKKKLKSFILIFRKFLACNYFKRIWLRPKEIKLDCL